jgi:hypothetical protein
MRRPTGFLVACVLMVLPFFLPASAYAQAAAGASPAAGAQSAGGGQPATPAPPPKVTFTGEIALWAFAVKPDKTADYEKAMQTLKEALMKNTRPEVKQQAAGWRVIKNAGQAQPDGTILYIHVINPVVKDADYSINTLVYEAFTGYAERKAFYDMYTGSVQSGFFLIQGPVVADMSK